MIPAKINMHKSGHKFALLRFPIVIDTLNQGRGTVTHTDYGYIYLAQGLKPSFPTEKALKKIKSQSSRLA
jgi:hypothetical protein